MTPERFGPYLLFKKLSEDRLGETFRAGKLGNDGIDQVVLLRALNGSALEGTDIRPQLGRRTGVQALLKSSNIARGIDMGAIQNVPYVAYEYLSGRTLDLILEEAVRQSHPLPLDHGLLILERVSLALAVAYESRLDGKRVLHGFVVPNHIGISYEGETKLLGFETGLALREMGGLNTPVRGEFSKYLSPEALTGAEPTQLDDIYSMGVILLEILLGKPLPPPDPHFYADLIEYVRSSGSADIADLVSQSVAPMPKRIPDIVTWHKKLTTIMDEGQHKSTTFNVAFFMHSLFRDKIELENEEIEAESRISVDPTERFYMPKGSYSGGPVDRLLNSAKTVPIPIAEPTPPPIVQQRPQTLSLEPIRHAAHSGPNMITGTFGAASSAPPAGGIAGMGPVAMPSGYGGAPGDESSLGKTLAMAAILTVTGAVGFWMWDSFASGPSSNPPPTVDAVRSSATGSSNDRSTRSSPTGSSDLESTQARSRNPAGTTISAPRTTSNRRARQPEDDEEAQFEAQADVEEVGSASKAFNRRTQFDQTTAELEDRLSRLVSERDRSEEKSLRAQYDREIAKLRARISEREKTLRNAQSTSSRQGSSKSSSSNPVTAEQRKPIPTVVDPSGTARGPVTKPATRSGAGNNSTSQQQTRSTPPATTATPTTRPGQAEVGQPLEPGPGVVAPKLITPLSPVYPTAARQLRREAEVSVRALVGPDGRVLDAQVEGPAAGLGFDDAALTAVRKAVFKPASKDGVPAKMWTRLRVSFQLNS
jgi:TonB family protein